MNKLEFWFKEIECFKKMTIDEAKELNKKMLEEKGEEERFNIRNKIVNGTLYNIYYFLKNSKLEILENSYYDMDDIISSTIEYYISELDSGRLLKVKGFTQIFDSNYYTFLNNSFATQRENIEMNQVIGLDNFGDFMEVFLKLMENNTDINFEIYFECLKKQLKSYNYCYYENEYFEYKKDYYQKCHNSLSQIYSKLDLESHDISKTKLKFLRHLLMERAISEQLIGYIVDQTDYEEEIIKNCCYADFISRVDEILVNDRMRKIIHERFGLDNGEIMTLENVSNNHNITRERVRQLESKALRYLRRDEKIQSYKGDCI